MIRPLTIVCLIAAGGAGMHLYSVKHQGMVLDRELREVRKSTEQVRDRTQVLRAEWAMLNEPARLRDAASRHLPLEPMQPQQFLRMTEVDHRLPATVAFAGAPSLFAPKTASPPQAAPVMVASLPVAEVPLPRRVAEAASPARPAPNETSRPASRQLAERTPEPRPQRMAALTVPAKATAVRPIAPVVRTQSAAPLMPAPVAPVAPVALIAPPRPQPTLVAAAAPRPQPIGDSVGGVLSRAAQGVSSTFSSPTMASALGALTTNLAPPVPFRSAVAATLDNSGRTVR